MHSHPRTMQRLALVRAGANGGDRTAGKWQWTGGEREGVYVTRVKCPECSETTTSSVLRAILSRMSREVADSGQLLAQRKTMGSRDQYSVELRCPSAGKLALHWSKWERPTKYSGRGRQIGDITKGLVVVPGATSQPCLAFGVSNAAAMYRKIWDRQKMNGFKRLADSSLVPMNVTFARVFGRWPTS
jgi:hypothetical protein